MKRSFLSLVLLLTGAVCFGQSWSLTGNSSLLSSNFLGSTNAQPLRLRVKNAPSGIIDSTFANTSYGYMSLFTITNIPISFTPGFGNTALGAYTLRSNTTGFNNTATGFDALRSNTTGSGNTANGIGSLRTNTIGSDNTALGVSSLRLNSSGNFNTGLGSGTLAANSIGSGNTAAGANALNANTTGGDNTAVGGASLNRNLTGSSNTAHGVSALSLNLSGSFNTAIGARALFTNDGIRNTAIGYESLFTNTTGNYNSAVGYQSLVSNSTGSNNTGLGCFSLFLNGEGINNTSSGYESLYSNTRGIGNAAYGAFALRNNTTGKANTAIGDSAMTNNTTGSNNTTVGYRASLASNNLVNATALGSNAIAAASNSVRIGNTSVTSIGGQVGWTNFSDGRIKKNIQQNVPGLTFIQLLNPVTYNFDLSKQFALEGRSDKDEFYQGKNEIEKMTFSGFIAQDVDEAAKKIGYQFSGIDKSGTVMGLRYSDFIVPIVKAVQELAVQNEELKKVNEQLKARLDKIEQILSGNATNNSSKNLSGYLEQNVPNPFNGTTTIAYYLPLNYTGSFINIYSQNGALLKTIRLTGEGRNTVSFSKNEFAKGVYNYVLVVDGKRADTKQMIID